MVSWIGIPCPILFDLVKGEGTLDQRIYKVALYALSGWMNPAPYGFLYFSQCKTSESDFLDGEGDHRRGSPNAIIKRIRFSFGMPNNSLKRSSWGRSWPSIQQLPYPKALADNKIFSAAEDPSSFQNSLASSDTTAIMADVPSNLPSS